jgi:TetR/AcrR family transcriptional regulator
MSEPGSKRGRTHDAEGAREAILNAAEQVFAEHGFDGARIDAIAKVAGYNKSLIFQYFGDKLGLYAEVIRRADEQTRELQNQALAAFSGDQANNPEQIRGLLKQFVGWYFDYLVAHPQILRIYNWEMAEGWQTLSKILTQRDFDDIDQFSAVLVNVKAAGMLRTDLNPVVQMTAAIFMCHSVLGMVPMLRILMPTEDFTSSSGLEATREYIVEAVAHGVLREPSELKEKNVT